MKIAVNNKHPLTLKYKHDRFGKHGKLDKHSKQNTKIQALANISFLMLACGKLWYLKVAGTPNWYPTSCIIPVESIKINKLIIFTNS